ncbi:hypothetical protein DM01DRAFT_1315240 [Hesseltinella vesiculosa]|uniref:Nucleotide-diphospho-sugar transferase n=1 Tax=Hesseltinella vesiculosa TaxID=101127 RepID=A0A1X2GV84_9FUNG|nr:hypothetical protein DM01DRAFT_1315240 [Hesseltinella vesiculosa]
MGGEVDLRRTTHQLRMLKGLHKYFDQRGINNISRVPEKDLPAWHFFHQLQTTHLSWIQPRFKDIFDLQRETMSEDIGFVMCVGNRKFVHAVHAMLGLRRIHNNYLPIEVYYRDDLDLDTRYQKYIVKNIPNVRMRRLDEIFDDTVLRLQGWDMKPFAMLASRFKEVMLLDSDAMFFYDPLLLFDEPGYKATGTMYYYDRSLERIPPVGGRAWVESFLPSYSTWLPQSRWWKGTSHFELHSPVVLLDKQKTFWGLIGACKLMDRWERDTSTFVHSHGDKESFWLGFEMTLTPYVFNSALPMTIGGFIPDVYDGTKVCGTVALPDYTGRPFWWNGGVYHNTYSDQRVLLFDYYAIGDKHISGKECIEEVDAIFDLEAEAKEAGQAYLKINSELKIELELLQMGAYDVDQF